KDLVNTALGTRAGPGCPRLSIDGAFAYNSIRQDAPPDCESLQTDQLPQGSWDRPFMLFELAASLGLAHPSVMSFGPSIQDGSRRVVGRRPLPDRRSLQTRLLLFAFRS